MLLKEALDQAMGDRMGTKERERAVKELRDIPFTSLLKQVLGQDRVVDKVSDTFFLDDAHTTFHKEKMLYCDFMV